jgi:hypothetical protein
MSTSYPGGRCFGAWFTEAEAARIRRAAAREGVDPSEWLRDAALRAVGASTPRAEPLTITQAMMTEAPPMPLDEMNAQLRAVLPHDLGGKAMAGHDQDRCPDCIQQRIQKLVRRGLRTQLAAELRQAGTLAAAYVGTLEAASEEQLNLVNTEHARRQRSVDRLVTQGDDESVKSIPSRSTS